MASSRRPAACSSCPLAYACAASRLAAVNVSFEAGRSTARRVAQRGADLARQRADGLQTVAPCRRASSSSVILHGAPSSPGPSAADRDVIPGAALLDRADHDEADVLAQRHQARGGFVELRARLDRRGGAQRVAPRKRVDERGAFDAEARGPARPRRRTPDRRSCCRSRRSAPRSELAATARRRAAAGAVRQEPAGGAGEADDEQAPPRPVATAAAAALAAYHLVHARSGGGRRASADRARDQVVPSSRSARRASAAGSASRCRRPLRESPG